MVKKKQRISVGDEDQGFPPLKTLGVPVPELGNAQKSVIEEFLNQTKDPKVITILPRDRRFPDDESNQRIEKELESRFGIKCQAKSNTQGSLRIDLIEWGAYNEKSANFITRDAFTRQIQKVHTPAEPIFKKMHESKIISSFTNSRYATIRFDLNKKKIFLDGGMDSVGIINNEIIQYIDFLTNAITEELVVPVIYQRFILKDESLDPKNISNSNKFCKIYFLEPGNKITIIGSKTFVSEAKKAINKVLEEVKEEYLFKTITVNHSQLKALELKKRLNKDSKARLEYNWEKIPNETPKTDGSSTQKLTHQNEKNNNKKTKKDVIDKVEKDQNVSAETSKNEESQKLTALERFKKIQDMYTVDIGGPENLVDREWSEFEEILSKHIESCVDCPYWLVFNLRDLPDFKRMVHNKFPGIELHFYEKQELISFSASADAIPELEKALAAILEDLSKMWSYDTYIVDKNAFRLDTTSVKDKITDIEKDYKIKVFIDSDVKNVSILKPGQEIVRPMNILIIVGIAANVQAAKQKLIEISEFYESFLTKIISIPNHLHKYIIGTKGKALAALINEFGTNCSISLGKTSHDADECTINGPSEEIKVLEKALMKKVAEFEQLHCKCDIKFEKKFLQAILNEKSKLIQKLRKTAPYESILFPDPLPIQSVNGAQNYNGNSQNITGKAPISPPKSPVKNAKGPYGKNDKNARPTSQGKSDKTSKNLNNSNSPTNSLNSPSKVAPVEIDTAIEIIGKKEHVFKCKAAIEEFIHDIQKSVVKTLPIPSRLAPVLTQCKDAFIKAISDDSGGLLTITVPENLKSGQLSIFGPEKYIQSAITILNKLAAGNSEELSYDMIKVSTTHLVSLQSLIFKIIENSGVRVYLPSLNKKVEEDVILLFGKQSGVISVKKSIEEAIINIKNTIEENFKIKADYKKEFLRKRNNEETLVQKLSAEHGDVRIFLGEKKPNDDLINVTVKGNSAHVANVIKAIQKLTSEYDRRSSAQVHFIVKDLYAVISKFRGLLKQTMDTYNVVLAVSESYYESVKDKKFDNMCDITIRGLPDNITKAKSYLESWRIVERSFYLKYYIQRNIFSFKSNHYQNLKSFMVDLKLGYKNEEPEDYVYITGLEENVTKASEYLDNAVDDEYELRTYVPGEFHRRLIGRNGSTVQKLNTDFNVTLNIPRQPGNNMVSIFGNRIDCQRADEEIKELINRWQSLCTKYYMIDAKLRFAICGPRNENIRKLAKTFDVSVNVPPPADKNDKRRVIEIYGVDDDTNNFMCKLDDIIDSLNEEVDDDYRYVARDEKPFELDIGEIPISTGASQKNMKDLKKQNSPARRTSGNKSLESDLTASSAKCENGSDNQ